jgi:hypothetical protein
VRLPYAKGAEADALHYDLLLWADIELGLAILAASAAALRPLLRHIPTLFDGTSGQRSHGTEDNGPYHELMVNRGASNPNKGIDSSIAKRPMTVESTTGAGASDEELVRVV